MHLPSASQRTHNPERFYSEDCNEVQQEEEEWQLPDEWCRILKMVFRSRDLEIVLNTKGADVVNIQIQYEIFICIEGEISDPNLEAG